MDHIDDVASCFDDCAAKKFPRVLMGNGACNSMFDPSYAPGGKHVAFWWPFAPYSVDGSPQEWERNRAEYTRRILDYWRIYASNLEGDNLIGTYLFTPLDVEKLNANMRQGAVRVGAYVPNQLGINRPHPLMPGSRTPVEGLYLCGSSSGNGGGINGAPGYIAANAIVDDLKLKRVRGNRFPRRSGSIDGRSPSGVSSSRRHHGARCDDVVDCGAARQIADRFGKTLQERADRLRAAEPLRELVGDIAGIEIGKNQDIGLAGDRAVAPLLSFARRSAPSAASA